MTHAETLLDMSRETRSLYRYYSSRRARTIQLPFRVSAAERDAIKAAAEAENKPVLRVHPGGDRRPGPRQLLQNQLGLAKPCQLTHHRD